MKFIKKLSAIAMVLALIVCAMPLSASAIIYSGGDFNYEISSSTGKATIVEYTGSDANVVIPTSYMGYPVTAIDDDAFSGNTKVEKVTIPETITSIGKYAFMNCTSLESISIPNTVTYLGSNVFYGCTALNYVEFNAAVTAIPQNTFYNCSSLTNVKIDSAITEIGNSAFYNCSKLTNLPTASIESYGQRAFYNTGITSLTVSDRVTSIPVYAFSGCANLERVIFIGTDTTIDSTAFNKSNSELTVYCKTGSTALQFAIDNSYSYVIVDSMLGDANADGYISISDVTLIQKHMARIAEMDEIQLLFGDVNGDGNITIRDATYIQMYLAKIIDTL